MADGILLPWIDYLKRELPVSIASLGTHRYINLQLPWVYASLRVRHL